MRFVVFLSALSCAWLFAEEPVSKVAFTESKSSVRAFTPYGETTLPVVRVQLEIHTSAGKTERGNLVVVYDPDSGHYLWHNTIANHPGDTSSFYADLESGAEGVFAGSPGLVSVYMPGPDLFIHEHNEHAENLDAAERASIGDIERQALVNNLYGSDMKDVPVYKAMGREFACSSERGQEDPRCMFEAKSIVSVSREGENWRIVVHNRWDQEIILDSKFNLVSTKRLPTAITPTSPH
jgi:hypothetical protein